MVPVSCPPWPGSITILPIFKPRARISDRSPLAVGDASRTSGKVMAGVILRLFRAEFLESVGKVSTGAGRASGALAAGFSSGGSSLATVTASSSSSASMTVFLTPLVLAALEDEGVLFGAFTCSLSAEAAVEASGFAGNAFRGLELAASESLAASTTGGLVWMFLV